ncbi:MAG: hypothetical protein GKR94_18445 [Gammaproteobacteria bacterium]|nr:hypothetical protein [Gammaproteobacteria bacterium]
MSSGENHIYFLFKLNSVLDGHGIYCTRQRLSSTIYSWLTRFTTHHHFSDERPIPLAQIPWHKYLNLLAKQQLSEGARRCYVRQVEGLLRAFPDKSLPALSKADIEAFLRDLPRQHRLQDGQFKQAMDALRLLLGWVSRYACGSSLWIGCFGVMRPGRLNRAIAEKCIFRGALNSMHRHSSPCPGALILSLLL